MLHGLPHRRSLGIEHGLFRSHDHFHLHVALLAASCERGRKNIRFASKPGSEVDLTRAELAMVAISRRLPKFCAVCQNKFSQARLASFSASQTSVVSPGQLPVLGLPPAPAFFSIIRASG